MIWVSRLLKNVRASDHPRTWRRLCAAAFCVAFLGLLQWGGALRSVDHQIRSVFFHLDARDASGEIILVDIDAESLSAVGQWPWPRGVYAELLDRLDAANPAEIAFDVDFSSVSTSLEDEKFAEALERHGGIMLASFIQNARAKVARSIVSKPISKFADQSWPVLVNVQPDGDGRIRKMPYGLVLAGEHIQSLAASIAYVDGEIGDSFFIDFGIRTETLPRISVIDVLEGADLNFIEGKRVLIGANAVELRDFFLAPRRGVIAGHELQALAAETLIQNRQIEVTPVTTNIGLAGLLGALALAFTFFVRLRTALVGLTVTAISLTVVAFVFHVQFACSIGISASLFSLLFGGIWKIAREHDFGTVLLSIWKGRAQNHEALIEAVVSESVEGVIIMGDDGRVLKQSKSASTILSLTGSLEGESLDEHFEDLSALAKTVMTSAMATGCNHSEQRELLIPSTQGEDRIIEAVATASHLMKTDEETGKNNGTYVVSSVMFRDITDRVKAEKEVRYLALHHQRTGLLNRYGFMDTVSELESDPHYGDGELGIVCINAIGLDAVETAIGHDLASDVVHQVADRISSSMLHGTTVGTIEDSIFAIALPNAPARQMIEADIGNALATISAPITAQGHTALITAHAGYAVLPTGPDGSVTELLKRATTAMHQARQAGQAILSYSEQIEQKIIQRQQLEVDLRRAIGQDEFFMQYQPLIDLKTGRIASAEALVRWRHPRLGLVRPDEFIPLAEEVGLIDRLSICIFNKVCRDIADFPDTVKIAVNLSPTHIVVEGFAAAVHKLTLRHGLSPDRFELEVTEAAAADDQTKLSTVLEELRSYGFKISLDDFGTGYSSLSYLRELPIDKLKIDRAFVHEFDVNEEAERLVRAITSLASALNLQTVLEGIESDRQADLAKDCGVNFGQGYYFAKPLDKLEFEALVDKMQSTLAA